MFAQYFIQFESPGEISMLKLKQLQTAEPKIVFIAVIARSRKKYMLFDTAGAPSFALQNSAATDETNGSDNTGNYFRSSICIGGKSPLLRW